MAKKTKSRLGKNLGQANQSKASRKETALMYAADGLMVVPLHGTRNGCCTCGDADCNEPGRHPRTKHGIEGASADPNRVKKLWTKWPKAKIGIATGASV